MAPLLKTEVGLVTMLRSRIETLHTLNDASLRHRKRETRKNLETMVGAVQWSFVFLPLLWVACERTKAFCALKNSSCTVRAAMGNWETVPRVETL